MNNLNSNIALTIQRKPNWALLCLLGIWLIGLAGLLVIFFYALITDSGKADGEFIFFTSIGFIVWIFGLKILWHLRGKERVSIDDKELRIEKLGTFLTSARKYELEFVESISITKSPSTPQIIKLWGFGGGQIQFMYLDWIKYFGQTLEIVEATRIAGQLSNALRKYKEMTSVI